MSSPTTPRPQYMRRPSLLAHEETHSPLGTRSGALASLIRSRSVQSMHSIAGSYHGHSVSFRAGPDDEETGSMRGSRPQDNDELGKLLMDERRLQQLLHGPQNRGPQNRSMKLIGRSNPRYRWERYWKSKDELKAMKRPMYVWLLMMFLLKVLRMSETDDGTAASTMSEQMTSFSNTCTSTFSWTQQFLMSS